MSLFKFNDVNYDMDTGKSHANDEGMGKYSKEKMHELFLKIGEELDKLTDEDNFLTKMKRFAKIVDLASSLVIVYAFNEATGKRRIGFRNLSFPSITIFQKGESLEVDISTREVKENHTYAAHVDVDADCESDSKKVN